MIKKIIYGFGSLIAVVAPVIGIVACGEEPASKEVVDSGAPEVTIDGSQNNENEGTTTETGFHPKTKWTAQLSEFGTALTIKVVGSILYEYELTPLLERAFYETPLIGEDGDASLLMTKLERVLIVGPQNHQYEIPFVGSSYESNQFFDFTLDLSVQVADAIDNGLVKGLDESNIDRSLTVEQRKLSEQIEPFVDSEGEGEDGGEFDPAYADPNYVVPNADEEMGDDGEGFDPAYADPNYVAPDATASADDDEAHG